MTPVPTTLLNKNLLVTVVFVLSSFLFNDSLLGQQMRFVEVVGTSTIAKDPDVARLKVSISGSGETAKEAGRRFREIRQEFSDAMGAMNFPEVALQFHGARINSSMESTIRRMENVFGEGENAEPEDELEYLEAVTVTFPVEQDTDSFTREISKVVDACILNKAHLSAQDPSELIYGEYSENRFLELDRNDRDQLKKQAIENAFADAKKQAEELARLGNIKLGPVVQVINRPRNLLDYDMYSMADEYPAIRQVVISAEVKVRFEIK